MEWDIYQRVICSHNHMLEYLLTTKAPSRYKAVVTHWFAASHGQFRLLLRRKPCNVVK